MAIDFIDEVRARSGRFSERLKHPLVSEEASKTAFVLPFIQMLGYDIFDPSEVVPEFTADVGTKRHEKVDYAIMRDGQPAILVECKRHGAPLHGEAATQLLRYFTVTDARIAILTDGVAYRFFSDLEVPNVMDVRSFFEFDMLDFTDPQVRELQRFTRSAFDHDAISTAARNLMYTNEIKRVLAEELAGPSAEFLNFIVRRVHTPGVKITPAARKAIRELAQHAAGQFMHDQVNQRLKTALAASDDEPPAAQVSKPQPERRPHSDLEHAALEVVRAIVDDMVDPQNIRLTEPRKHYTSVGLSAGDGQWLGTICRLGSNRSTVLSVAVDYVAEQRKWQPYRRLEDVNGLTAHRDAIRARIAMLMPD